ncbi:nucleotidyltransferase domain-containing protein [Psychrobacillus soli]|uniref:Polymerase nucleotidyl transferase domain-containing protein n=1 Tax=Psychrobacillus soli TaxID=1543965 RepID=A0A544TBH1_9BACI|nr:nucleotidyltransferase domain-containing protein [Psychrobacillus soli]TQR14748.1 hypothetical protein FG383_10535 [Psychrobacillus soli]
MFQVLIGSVARNDFSRNSDIDICRIGNRQTIERKDSWPIGPINYIDYELEVFEHLFEIGSLFILHILFEGVLIKGDKEKWENYKSNFCVKDNFNEELEDINEMTDVFNNLEMFGNKYLTLYSNLFTLIKNYSIFTLANEGIYIFNKEKAVKRVFGDFYYNLLFDSNNYFERGIVNEIWDYECKKTAQNIINYYITKIKEKN